VWGIPAVFTWLLSWAGASVNYTLVFCLFPELILACPGLVQGIILSRLLPESRLPLRLWLFLTILAAIVAWVGLWFFALTFGGVNDPVESEPGLVNQTMSAVMLGTWIGIITGMIQWMILDSYIPDITPGWILLSLSSWVTTAVFFLVLLPALLRPVPLTILNDTPVTPACRSGQRTFIYSLLARTASSWPSPEVTRRFKI
jgi:hypothetical protein